MKFLQLIQDGRLFDSHCHLNSESYDADRDEVVERAKIPIIDIGVNYESSKKAVENSRKYENVFACVGIDPEVFIPGSELFVGDQSQVEREIKGIRKLIKEEIPQPPLEKGAKIIMIGETGVDLYWNRKNNLSEEQSNESFENQQWLFEQHIQLASEYNLPLSIHSRDAVDECLETISKFQISNSKIKGVYHSLTPDFNDDEKSFYEKVNRILDSGFMIGLNGIITYKSARLLRDTTIKVIREKIRQSTFDIHHLYEAGFVLETDGPYLSPEGKRGERNEPGNVGIVLLNIRNHLNH